jgi:hypothetical protein
MTTPMTRLPGQLDQWTFLVEAFGEPVQADDDDDDCAKTGEQARVDGRGCSGWRITERADGRAQLVKVFRGCG